MEYAYSLKSKNIEIKDVFVSYVSSDSSYHCGLTNTRLMNVLMCQIMNDWEWQFLSLPIEREFGNFFDKDVYIKWGHEHDIPLYKTRTCVKRFDIECGDCPTCWDRRRAYKEAGVVDRTKYKYETSKNYPTYYDHEAEEKLHLKDENRD
jgi:7-cyano-7-deazaguanine synthase in queuosine biosynthesis